MDPGRRGFAVVWPEVADPVGSSSGLHDTDVPPVLAVAMRQTGQVTLMAMLVAGGLGAVARFVLDSAVRSRLTTQFPVGTLVVNAIGSLLLGILTAAVLRDGLSASLTLIGGTGFLGGFTTFSTACVETVRLVQQGRRGWALANLLGAAAVCVGCAALGFWVG